MKEEGYHFSRSAIDSASLPSGRGDRPLTLPSVLCL